MSEYQTTSDEFTKIEDPENKSAYGDVEIILGARQDVQKVRSEARSIEYAANHLRANQARAHYYSTAKSYALTIVDLLQSDEHGDPELWANKKLYATEVTGPTINDLNKRLRRRCNPGTFKVIDDAQSVEIQGVRGFVQTQPPINLQFKYQIDHCVEGEHEGEHITQHVPPTSAVDNIVSELDAFRRDIGLGLTNPDEIGAESHSPY